MRQDKKDFVMHRTYLTIIFQILLCVFQHSNTVLAVPPELSLNWQRVQIPDVGTIDIPSTMEVQEGMLAEIGNELNKQLNLQNDSSKAGRFVIQQRGLNALEPEAVKLYMRIIVETNIETLGELETLNSHYTIPQDELQEISLMFRKQIESLSGVLQVSILQWDKPLVDVVNGMQAVRLSYIRQIKDNPPVRVVTYLFQNYDRMHNLTISYGELGQDRWLSDFPAILKSFQITNVRGPVTPTVNPMTVIYGENWILNIIISAILTWGIGLAPPLLTRFVILKRPISKISAVVFVVIFWFVNITIFIGLGSQSKTHSALFFVAIASYYILRAGWRERQIMIQQQHIPKNNSQEEQDR